MRARLAGIAVTAAAIAAPAAAVHAQSVSANASARVSPEVAEIGRTFQYAADLTVQGGEQIQLATAPDFGRFQVVNQSRFPQLITINGVTERRLSVRYTLRSAQTGTFEIGPPVFDVNGEKIRPDPVSVEIVEQGEAPSPSPSENSRFFIHSTVDPDSAPFVGEQVTLRYDLYVDGAQLDISPRASREPSLDDFWIEELTERVPKRDQVVTVNGRMMKKMPMWTYALFPLRPGPVTIEPAEMELVVGAFFRRGQLVEVASDPIELTVKPLPPNAPRSFSEGNVGDFDFKVRTDQSSTRVGRAFVVELEVNGSGQMSRVELPKLPELDGARISDVDEDTRQQIRSLDVGGIKVVRYTVTPLREGSVRIPELRFGYFDPETAEYEVIESAPITIRVAPGTLPQESVAAEDVATREQAADEDLVEGLLARLRATRTDADDDAAADPARFPPVYWVLIALSMLYLLWELIGDRIRDGFARRAQTQETDEATADALETLRAAGTDPGEVMRAIRDALADGFGLPRGLITGGELVEACADRGLDVDAARELAAVLSACEEARYAPDATIDEQATDRAMRAIGALRISRTGAPVATGIALVLIATALAGAVIVPNHAYAQTAGESADRPEETDWRTVADGARVMLDREPASVDALYNLGTASAHLGDYATARWALVTAEYYAPWSNDVQENLEVIERIVRLQAIERSRTGRTIDGDEVLFWWGLATHVNPHLAGLLTALLWLLCAAAIRRRRNVENQAGRDALFVGIILAGLFAAGATFGTAARDRLLQTTEAAVVTIDAIDLREGPNDAAKLKRTPPAMVPGTLVRITSRQGNWVKLVWATGSGWTTTDAVRPIGEASPTGT